MKEGRKKERKKERKKGRMANKREKVGRKEKIKGGRRKEGDVRMKQRKKEVRWVKIDGK